MTTTSNVKESSSLACISAGSLLVRLLVPLLEPRRFLFSHWPTRRAALLPTCPRMAGRAAPAASLRRVASLGDSRVALAVPIL